MVGGASESLNVGDKEKVKLYIIRRKGFIKLALQYGRDLVPVFGFGENDMYEQLPNPEGSRTRRLQQWMEKYLTFTLPLFHGRDAVLSGAGLDQASQNIRLGPPGSVLPKVANDGLVAGN